MKQQERDLKDFAAHYDNRAVGPHTDQRRRLVRILNNHESRLKALEVASKANGKSFHKILKVGIQLRELILGLKRGKK